MEVFGMPAILFIFLISIALSLMVSLIYKFGSDQVLMKELKADLKKYQAQMKEHRTNPEKMSEVQKLLMSTNSKYMMQSFKPMIITMIPFFIIFHFLRKLFAGATIINLSFHVPLSGLETGLGWIGTYIIFSMIFTTIFRKLLKVV